MSDMISRVARFEQNIIKLSLLTGLSAEVCGDIVRNTAKETGESLGEVAAQMVLTVRKGGDIDGFKRSRKNN